MTKDEILTGIHDAECRPELKAHTDRVDAAINRGECDYSHEDWKEISEYIGIRIKQLG